VNQDYLLEEYRVDISTLRWPRHEFNPMMIRHLNRGYVRTGGCWYCKPMRSRDWVDAKGRTQSILADYVEYTDMGIEDLDDYEAMMRVIPWSTDDELPDYWSE
jgi:hypothetical protein